MLKFEEVKSVVKDNEVVINGHSIGKVTDDEAKYIISLIQGKVTHNKPVATSTLHFEEPINYVPMAGEKIWQDDHYTVTDNNGEYRLYIQAHNKDQMKYLKDKAKDGFGVKWSGDYKAHDIFWSFPNKTTANKFIKAQKEYYATRENKSK